jgi:hypothetical protein
MPLVPEIVAVRAAPDMPTAPYPPPGLGPRRCQTDTSLVSGCVRDAFVGSRLGGRTRFMAKETWRLVTRGTDGELVIHDFDSPEALRASHLQIGTDDCSTDLELRGAPVFRELVGPMPEGRSVVRYETPEVFEVLTREWATPKPPRCRRRKADAAPQTPAADG